MIYSLNQTIIILKAKINGVSLFTRKRMWKEEIVETLL
jgi:hypothetical protein